MATPRISVVTPSHSFKCLEVARQSLLRQSFQDWEWIVLVNGKCSIVKVRELMKDDPRIKVLHFSAPSIGGKMVGCDQEGNLNVGALKSFGFQHASAPLHLEFDHDDELAYNCLEEVVKAFDENEDAVFVYSDVLRWDVKENKQAELFGEQWGWRVKNAVWQPTPDVEPSPRVINENMPTIPQHVSRIWCAPDHVRAWRAEAYKKVGGHNINLSVCDDLDLMCKLYIEGRFHFIDKVLYKYNVHETNTWKQRLEQVQNLCWMVHDQYIEQMTLAEAQRNEELVIDLGGGINAPKGWTTVDQHNSDVTCDLNEKWPWADGSVAAFRAHDILEHLKNPIHVMNEAFRCLKPGGLFLIEVPSTDGRGAFQDPTHVSFWNTNSFWYYTNNFGTQRFLKHAGINCQFQEVRVANVYPSDWHRAHEIVYARVHLSAIKGPRTYGIVHFDNSPQVR